MGRKPKLLDMGEESNSTKAVKLELQVILAEEGLEDRRELLQIS